MCKYGCLSDTDKSSDFGFEEVKCEDGSKVFEYTCEPCLESEGASVSSYLEFIRNRELKGRFYNNGELK